MGTPRPPIGTQLRHFCRGTVGSMGDFDLLVWVGEDRVTGRQQLAPPYEVQAQAAHSLHLHLPPSWQGM